jgi:Pretoxin HINT domain
LYVDGEVITTTSEHPFWVPGTGWVEAEDLQVGMLLQTDEEKVLDVDKIEKRQEKQTVYNFEVEDFHTYFVSDLGLLVHNTCGDILAQTIDDDSITVGSGYPWTGNGAEPKWGNVKSKAYGHALSDHGPKGKASDMQNRANSKGFQGQWYNAEDIIAAEQMTPPHPGVYVIEFERPIGRVFVKGGSPDTAIQDVSRAFVKRRFDGTIATAYPINNIDNVI